MIKYPSQINVKTVRLSPETHAALKALSAEWQMTIGSTVKALVRFAKDENLSPEIVLSEKTYYEDIEFEPTDRPDNDP